MFVLSFFPEVDVSLVSHKQLMATISRTELGGVPLITVPQHNAMKGATQQKGYGVIRAVSQTTHHLLVLMLIHQSACHVATLSSSIIFRESG